MRKRVPQPHPLPQCPSLLEKPNPFRKRRRQTQKFNSLVSRSNWNDPPQLMRVPWGDRGGFSHDKVKTADLYGAPDNRLVLFSTVTPHYCFVQPCHAVDASWLNQLGCKSHWHGSNLMNCCETNCLCPRLTGKMTNAPLFPFLVSWRG